MTVTGTIGTALIAAGFTLFPSMIAHSEGNARRGGRSFGACAACHSLQPNQSMTGPSLAGLWNRKAGSLASFTRYSSAQYEIFHSALYRERGHVEEAQVLAVAGAVGIDVGRIKADLQDKTIERQLQKNEALGQALQITGTPGFVVGDQITTGARDLKDLQSLIDDAPERRAGDEVRVVPGVGGHGGALEGASAERLTTCVCLLQIGHMLVLVRQPLLQKVCG